MVSLIKRHDSDCDCAAPYLATNWHTFDCAYAQRVMKAAMR